MSCSNPQQGKSALARSRSIDHQLDEERERRQKEAQLLVLGGSGSGKSTFIKQMRLKYGDGFPEGDRCYFKPFIFENITHALHRVLDHMISMNIDFVDGNMKETVAEFEKKYPRIRALLLHTVEEEEKKSEKESEGLCPARPRRLSNFYCHYEKPNIALMLKVWHDPGLQECYRRLSDPDIDRWLSYSEEYFLSNVHRITQQNYIPTIPDILHIRRATLGVQESIFTINNLSYRLIDVAGQKSQRKKWIHFFDGVSAVLFFTALSGFDEILEEEPTVNSMQDSLQTFSDVVNNQFLEKTDFIILFNKEDLFIRKLKFTQLSRCFTEYTGNNTPDECLEFIQQKFLEKKPTNKHVYMHVSCAINVDHMKKVLDNIFEMIVEINLRKCSNY